MLVIFPTYVLYSIYAVGKESKKGNSQLAEGIHTARTQTIKIRNRSKASHPFNFFLRSTSAFDSVSCFNVAKGNCLYSMI